MDGLVEVGQGLVAQVQEQPATALVVTLIAICIATRLVTGRGDSSHARSYLHDAHMPPAVPYWIPYLGHLPQIVFGPDSFLAGLGTRYPGGAFTLSFLGGTHTVLYRPGLYRMLFSRPEHVVDGGRASRHLLQSVFGYPRSKQDLAVYDKILKDLEQQYTSLLSGQSLGQMVQAMTDRLRHNVADFVTFNASEIDQAHWERLADAALVEDTSGREVVEANLFELVRNFAAFTANPSLVGTDFVENFPEFWQALWRLDRGFLSLALDLPAALPLNKAIGARRARGFLLRSMDEFQAAMDAVRNGDIPAPQWADLENVSPLMRHRVDDVFRRNNLSTQQRSALDLALVWAMNANTNPVIFWVLWRAYARPGLVSRIRREIAPFVVLEKPAVGFGAAFGTATRIEGIDVEGILHKCPLLKASYIETLRLDFDGWNFRHIREDTVVGEKEGEKFILRAGTYAHVAAQLGNMDPSAYDDPEVWRPERHIRKDATGGAIGQEPVSVDMGDLRPFGGGQAICNGHEFAVREVMLFSAAIIAMYDIEPVGGGSWKLPKRERSAGARHPISPARVWIRSRPI